MKKLILIGGGGHSLSLLETIQDLSDVVGYLALSPSDKMPVPWLGVDADAIKYSSDHKFHVAFVYHGLPVMDKRSKLIATLDEMGLKYESIIAQTAIVTRNSHIGEGCAALNSAVVNRATLGRHVIVNTGAIVEHDCEVGDNTFIGPGAVIGGAVSIGKDCFIGLGARIKNCISIADGVSVGMGAVVTDDLREPGIYHGNPLKFHPLRRKQ